MPTKVYMLTTTEGYLEGALDTCAFNFHSLCLAACEDVREHFYFGDRALNIALEYDDKITIKEPNGDEHVYYIHELRVVK